VYSSFVQGGAANYDVFLSYSRADAAAAGTLRSRLAEAGLSAFLDRYGLPAGQPWQPWLEQHLGSCRALVVLVGPKGFGEWQHREIQLGLDRQASVAKSGRAFPVIPVLLPKVENDAIPVGRFLNLNTWVDLRNGLDDPEGLQRLAAGAQGQTIDKAAAEKLLAGLSPYRGLLPFREQDGGLFFGRQRFVDEVVRKVGQCTTTNVVAVIGRSGSGKSSILYAGLFPALRRERGLAGQSVWQTLDLRPRDGPLQELALVFNPPNPDLGPVDRRAELNRLANRLRNREVSLAELVRDRLRDDPGSTRLLLYVDQWEELYTLATPREINTDEDRARAVDAKLFIDLVLEAAAKSPCTLALSVRSDFYPDLQSHDGLRVAVQENQVSLGTMNEAELRDVIEGPPTAHGASVDAKLTEKLIRDIGLDPASGRSDEYDIGKLPLLEYALEQAWARRTGPRISLADYPGLEQALEERANALYGRLSAEEQAAAKRLFVSLVTPGEGREDTRRRIDMPEGAAMRSVVETFAGTEARLVVTDQSDGRRSVEVSHEALIRHWDRLRTWIDENRDNLRTRDFVRANRTEWLKHDRDPNLLDLPRLHLEAAKKLRDQPGDVVIDEVRDYIDAALERQRWKQEADQAKQRKELEKAQRLARAERTAKEAAEAAVRAEAEARTAAEQRTLAETQARQAAEHAAIDAKARAAAEADKASAERKARETAETAADAEQAAKLQAQASASKLRKALSTVAALGTVALIAFGISLYYFKQASRETIRATELAKERQSAFELATKRAQETQLALDRANEALARAIQNDLVFDVGPRTARTRNALWELALSADVIKSNYFKILKDNPGEVSRIAAGFAEVYRATAMQKLPTDEAAKLVEVVIDNFSKIRDLNTGVRNSNINAGLEELHLLTPFGAELQIQAAIDRAALEISQTSDPRALEALARAVEALPPKLSDAQAQATIKSILDKIEKTDDPNALLPLAQAAEALSPQLSDAQAQAAIKPILDRIQNTGDPSALGTLAQAVEALSPQLSDAQAQAAIKPILDKIQRTDDPSALEALAQGVEALSPKLSEAQAQAAIKPILDKIQKTDDPSALRTLAQAVEALSPKLSDAQAQAAIKLILYKIQKTVDPSALEKLAQAAAALSPKLSDAQAEVAIKLILDKIQKTDDSNALEKLAQAVEALSPKLSDAQAQATIKPILDKIQKTDDSSALEKLAQAVEALPPKLSDTQAQAAIKGIFDKIQTTDRRAGLLLLAEAVSRLPLKLSDAQAQAALAPVFDDYTPGGLRPVAEAFRDLAPQLSDAQAQAAIKPVLDKIKATENSDELSDQLASLAEIIVQLVPKLSDAQAQAALEPILDKIKELEISDGFSYALGEFANVLQVLAQKLTEPQARGASDLARAALAWSSTREEAADWARALIALLTQAADPDRTKKLVAAVVYPTAAGEATEVLLEAIHGKRGANLFWLAQRYPEVLQPPICPDPPLQFEISGLKCPDTARASAAPHPEPHEK
jgi:hypothetical protein